MAIDSLTLAATRRAVRDVALILSGMERDEADRFLSRLYAEIGNLKSGDTSSAIWFQVVSGIQEDNLGPACYGLKRIGLLKDTEDANR